MFDINPGKNTTPGCFPKLCRKAMGSPEIENIYWTSDSAVELILFKCIAAVRAKAKFQTLPLVISFRRHYRFNIHVITFSQIVSDAIQRGEGKVSLPWVRLRGCCALLPVSGKGLIPRVRPQQMTSLPDTGNRHWQQSTATSNPGSLSLFSPRVIEVVGRKDGFLNDVMKSKSKSRGVLNFEEDLKINLFFKYPHPG